MVLSKKGHIMVKRKRISFLVIEKEVNNAFISSFTRTIRKTNAVKLEVKREILFKTGNRYFEPETKDEPIKPNSLGIAAEFKDLVGLKMKLGKMVHQPKTNGWIGKWDFKTPTGSIPFFLFFLLGVSPSMAQVTYTTCPSGNPAPGYAQTQQMVATGVGLDYALVGGPCGQPLTVTLPPGAVPVTSYLYVEYNPQSFVAAGRSEEHTSE